MISLNNLCIDTIQRHPNVYINFSDVESLIRETVESLNHNVREFLMFAYELRKQDLENGHTSLLLHENIYPQILIDIVLSNYWDPTSQTMCCDTSTKFQMLMQENYPLVYNKVSAKNVNQSPTINKYGFDPRQFTEHLHYLITPNGGLQVFTDDMSCTLATRWQFEQGSHVSGGEEAVTWQNDEQIQAQTNLSNIWYLDLAFENSDEPFFFINSSFGYPE